MSDSSAERPPLHLFDAAGIELEYMIADRDTLDVRPVSDAVLREDDGSIASEIEHGSVSWSNELMLHVLELKTTEPARSLVGVADGFAANVTAINDRLAAENCRLMPSAMHPWMNPHTEARLWPHDYSSVYEAFNRVFDCRGHGWANLQSMHINLPFDGDDEFGRLHAAVRLVLPLLPALAAASPVADGRLTGFADYRLEVYRNNARRVPFVSGRVIPEAVYDEAAYNERIFKRMFADIAPLDPEGTLQHVWLNARGAIARFDRGSIEIRVIDVQECPRADLAIASLVIETLRRLVSARDSSFADQSTMGTERLADLFLRSIRDAEATPVEDPEIARLFGLSLRPDATLGELWKRLYERIRDDTDPALRPVLAPVERILDQGPLARRILRAAGFESGGDDGREVPREAMREVWGSLCDCLAENRMFDAPAR